MCDEFARPHRTKHLEADEEMKISKGMSWALLVICVASAVACSSLKEPERSELSDHSSTEPCNSMEDLKVTKPPVADYADRVSYANSNLGVVKVRRVLLVSGKCSERIAGYQADSAYLSDGRVLAVEPSIGLSDDGRTYVAPTLITIPPAVGGDGFVMAHRVAYIPDGSGTAEIFVGLWSDDSESRLKVFRKSPTGNYGEAQELMRTASQIGSVRYLASPDTMSGSLTITEKDKASIALISIDWTHQNLAAAIR